MHRISLATLLAFAGLVLQTLAQKQFYTSGLSGPSCGKAGNRCLSNAWCNMKKVICQCKPPLSGNGKLGCFKPGDAVSFIQLDPNIKTFHGDYMSIPTPCRYKVLHYTMATANGARASAEVYAKNILSRNGDYYVNNVLVSISVMTPTKVGKYSVLLEGVAADGHYSFFSTVLEDSMTKSPFILELDLNNYTIGLSVDKVNNFIIARIDGVGLTVKFRPPAIPLEGRQTMVPGVTMVIDKKVVDSVKFVNGTLSSSPFGPNITTQAKEMNVDLQQYVHLLAIFNTPAIIMDDRMCQDTTVIFKNVCKNDTARITLLNTCSSLYNDKEFLRCIYDKSRLDQVDVDSSLFFRYCAEAFCLQRTDICQTMLQRIQSTQCPLPAKLKNFQCSTESLRIS